LGQVDLSCPRELLEKASPGVGRDDALDLCLELGDGVQQRAQELDLGADEWGRYLRWESGGRGGCQARSAQQFGGGVGAAVGVAAQEGGRAGLAESGG